MPEQVAALAARAITIAEAAAETQKTIVATQAAIVARQAKDRRNFRWLVGGWLIDVALSVLFVFLAFGQAHVSADIHASQLHACAIGNEFRAGQVALWDHVIAVSQAPPHETAAEQKARLAKLAAFRAYIGHQFKPVDCAKLYGKP